MDRQRTKAEREHFYAENPDVETWIRMKAALQKTVVGYWILLTIFQIIAKVQMQDLDGIGIQVGVCYCRFHGSITADYYVGDCNNFDSAAQKPFKVGIGRSIPKRVFKKLGDDADFYCIYQPQMMSLDK